MSNVVIYTRVSTEEQKKSGFSLQDQERRLMKRCEELGHDVIRHYQDDHSAKDFNRPAFNNLITDLEERSIKPKQLWCVSHDRFARNAMLALSMIEKLKEFGLEVVFLENHSDAESPFGKLIQVLNFALPEVDNMVRSEKTKAGQRQALREGRWMWRAPKGYTLNPMTKLMELNEDSRFVKKAFELVASRSRTSTEEIRKELRKEGFKCPKQTFLHILKNPIYKGIIRIEAWKDEPEEEVIGLHDPLVTAELFASVQHELKRRSKFRPKPKRLNEKFPLRGFLTCSVCDGTMTASSSKGRRKYYDYYHCQGTCKSRYDANTVHIEFLNYLNEISPSEAVKSLYLAILGDVIDRSGDSKAKKISAQKKVLLSQEKQLDGLDNRLMNQEIGIEDYNRISKKIKQKINQSQDELYSIENTPNISQAHLNLGVTIMTDLREFYENSSFQVKRNIVGSIFKKGIQFDGKKYRTIQLNELVELLSRPVKELESLKRKQAAKNNGLSHLAPPLGLEPRTL